MHQEVFVQCRLVHRILHLQKIGSLAHNLTVKLLRKATLLTSPRLFLKLLTGLDDG